MSSISGDKPIHYVDPNTLGQTQGTQQTQTTQGTQGTAPVQSTQRIDEVTDVVETGAPRAGNTTGPSTAPILPPSDQGPNAGESAGVLADNVEQALAPLLNETPEGVSLENLSVDQLMRMFMALNIMDPNESNEVKNNLNEAKTSLKQAALEQIEKEIEALKEKIEEMEAKKSMFGFLSAIFMVINPMGMIGKLLGETDNKALGIIGGVLAPEQMFITMFGAKHEGNLEETKLALQLAEDRLGRVGRMEDVILGGDVAKQQRAEAEQFMEAKLATNAGEDGVPLKTIADKMKGKLGKVMEQLQQMMAEMGPQATMAAAPEMFKQACLEVLQELDIKDAEAIAEGMAGLLTMQLTQEIVAAGGAPENAMGPTTLILGETLDPESKLDKSSTNSPLFAGAAFLDALSEIKSYAALNSTESQGQTFIS